MTTAGHYADMFDEGGRRATLERVVVNQPARQVRNVRVRIRGLTKEEIASGITSDRRVALVLAEDVPADFLPLKGNDRILIDDLRLTFAGRPDDQTHRDGDVLLAIGGFVTG